MYRDSSGHVIGYNVGVTNFHTNDTVSTMDDNGHGTINAGIAAAQINSGVGVAGIAGWNGVAGQTDTSNVKIVPVKVLYNDSQANVDNSAHAYGASTTMNVAKGINWVASLNVNGKKIISMSLTTGRFTPGITRTAPGNTMGNAIENAYNSGCLMVAAAGNDGQSQSPNANTPDASGNYSYDTYPASVPHILSVAASDGSDTLTQFSHYGDWINVAAPGFNIYSTMPTYAASLNNPGPNRPALNYNYDYQSGTSQACPHVAGEAALIWSQNPSLTNDQVTSIIQNNTDPVIPFPSHGGIGGGRVNVYRALVAATSHGSDVKLLPVGNYLYGTTLAGGAYSRGTIFLADPYNNDSHAAGRVLYSFTGGADGAHPFGGMVQGPDGYLYGTCSQGGQYGWGTVWRINPDGSGFSVAFQVGAANGGTPGGGTNPRCAVTFTPDNYTFVGVMPNGGASGQGTFFASNRDGGYINLYNFSGPPYDGSSPTDGVTLGSDGAYWGVTQTGGNYGLGTVWRNFYTTAPSGHSVPLFIGQYIGGSTSNGAFPRGLLVELPGGPGTFVGTMQAGGSGGGTIFATNAQGGFNPLYAFGSGTPNSGLIVGSDGAFWGVTPAGGQYGLGTVYRQTYTTDPSGHSVVQNIGDFSGGSSQNGAAPIGALTVGLGYYGATYFGATSQGGDFENGCVYALNANGGRRLVFMFPANF